NDNEVEKFLGEGSFGKVAKCKKLGTDQVVAIKIIWGSGQMEINALEELSQINADDHNLVKFVESFKYKKYTCIAFEVLDQSLLDFMEKRDFHPLTVEEIRTIAWQLVVALKGLKSVNLVHCDIKLDNIMLVDHVSEPFRVKLIDFGLAEKIGHMRTGATMQNICYRAPEVILGLPLDQSVDLWTVGYILFVLYTGSFIHGWDTKENSQDVWKLDTAQEQSKKKGRLVEDNIPFWSCHQLIHSCLDKTKLKEVEQFVDLLKRMLMVDPSKRISPSEALQHPFFTMGRVQPTAAVEVHLQPEAKEDTNTPQRPAAVSQECSSMKKKPGRIQQQRETIREHLAKLEELRQHLEEKDASKGISSSINLASDCQVCTSKPKKKIFSKNSSTLCGKVCHQNQVKNRGSTSVCWLTWLADRTGSAWVFSEHFGCPPLLKN
uniref:Protein kinase domain-containing protein n=1 Tax=Oryzias sinensis TaxID=183150 RepID=A0A8C7YZ17_9TELE